MLLGRSTFRTEKHQLGKRQGCIDLFTHGLFLQTVCTEVPAPQISTPFQASMLTVFLSMFAINGHAGCME